MAFIAALITSKEFHVNDMVTPKVGAKGLPVRRFLWAFRAQELFIMMATAMVLNVVMGT